MQLTSLMRGFIYVYYFRVKLVRPCGFDPLPVKDKIYSLTAGATSFPSALKLSASLESNQHSLP